ncbi:MAG: AAA family ATPase [Eubacteriales bacterium]|nr:AAA family ATPase [Eubacteriales bacterium]
MTIEKLYIGCFGGLRDFTLEPDSGINVIEGPNEAGKTTAAAFCAYILYGFDRDRNEKALRLNRGSSAANGYLEIIADGQRYRIERESSANGRDRVKIIELTGNTVCMKGSVPGEVFLGVPAELYYHTAHVTQAQGAVIDGTGVYEALENILFSGDEAVSIQKAQKKLDEARVSLLHKNEKGGRIAELKKERENLDARLYRASEGNKKIILTESSLSDTRENLEANKNKLYELELRLNFYNTDTAIRNFDRLHALRAEEAGLEAEYKKSIADNTHLGFIPDSTYTAKLKELDIEIRHLRAEVHSIDEERARHVASEPDKEGDEALIAEIGGLGGKYEILSRAETNMRKIKFRRLAGIAAIIITLSLLTAAGVLYLKGFPVFTAITAAAMIASAAAAVICFKSALAPRQDTDDILRRLGANNTRELERLLDESRSHEIKLGLYYDRLAEIDTKHGTCASKLEGKQKELDALLRKWGRDTVNGAVTDAENMFARSQKRISGLENLRTEIRQYEELLVGYDEAAVRDSYTGLSDDFEKYNFDSEKDRQNISTLRTNCDFTRKQNASLVERCHLLENQLTELRAVTEKPAQLADRIYALDEEIASASKRHRACVLAGEMLTAAAENLRSNITPNLSAESGKLLKTVTDGRYGEVGIGTDMSLVYTVRDRGADTRGVEYMSAGTRDLAYISLRLALMNFIYRASVPPVIFDESFARLDDRRLELTFRLLAEYAQRGYQIILLTAQKRDALIMESIADFRHIKLV